MILVVDDDASMRALVRLHLATEGYEVLEAADPIDAAPLVMGAAPDLVLCDLNMPHMNGCEFVAVLKAHPATRAIPVVLVTGEDDVAELARRAGAAGWLKKPVAARQLLALVESLSLSQTASAPARS